MNPNTAAELRALAETVRRLVSRDKAQTAVHLVSRQIAEDALAHLEDSWKKANLLNLRGCALADQGRHAEAAGDFAAASALAPAWVLPLYNQGLCCKALRRWADAADLLRRALARRDALHRTNLERRVRWNLGLALTALRQFDEAQGQWQQMKLPRGDELGQLALPIQGPYKAERVWSIRIDPARARILSVVRYGAPCQFGDVVLLDMPGMSVCQDGLGEAEQEEEGGARFLEQADPAGFRLYEVSGGKATPTQAMALTEHLREAGLHIEVWTLTMRLPKDADRGDSEVGPDGARPVRAGLVLGSMLAGGAVPAPGSKQEAAEKAAAALREAASKIGVPLYCPGLMVEAGDELGAARHKRGLRALGAK